MQSIQDQFVKWQEWIKRIEGDITNRLVLPRRIHRELVEVVNANLDHVTRNSGQYFVNFVRYGYAAQVAMGIRRHVKSKDDSVSLMRLLKQVGENARRFTYKFFLEQFPIRDDYVNWQEPTFRRFSDDMIAVSEPILIDDMQNLKALAKNVEDMVDKEIAHLDKKPHAVAVTFGDLEKCIDELDGLVCKYRTLFGGGGMSTLEPTILFDWEEILLTGLSTVHLGKEKGSGVFSLLRVLPVCKKTPDPFSFRRVRTGQMGI